MFTEFTLFARVDIVTAVAPDSHRYISSMVSQGSNLYGVAVDGYTHSGQSQIRYNTSTGIAHTVRYMVNNSGNYTLDSRSMADSMVDTIGVLCGKECHKQSSRQHGD